MCTLSAPTPTLQLIWLLVPLQLGCYGYTRTAFNPALIPSRVWRARPRQFCGRDDTARMPRGEIVRNHRGVWNVTELNLRVNCCDSSVFATAPSYRPAPPRCECRVYTAVSNSCSIVIPKNLITVGNSNYTQHFVSLFANNLTFSECIDTITYIVRYSIHIAFFWEIK